jgi:UDP:flavonoid glycosyltransferase YjiC (YdhE family)
MLPLARAAQRAGHDVVVATGPDLVPGAERHGLAARSVGGGQRRGSGSGRVNRLFDQLHEARRVVREAPHVARVVELDGRRSSALGHEPL